MARDFQNNSLNADAGSGQTTNRWLELALIFAVFFVEGGALAPHVNETYYLTKAKHYWDPAWCAGDMFLESADAHLTFYWTVGWLARWFSLTTVAWIGRTAVWALLAWAWQRLSRRIVRGPYSAVLTAAMFVALLHEAHFAGEWVVGGVEGKCFAYALVFFGLAALAGGNLQRVWPAMGLAGAFHVLVGGWSTIAAGLVWLTEPRANRPPLRGMLPAIALGGVLALPGIVPALQLTRGVSPEVRAEANQIYVFDRLPHHLAPLTTSPKNLYRRSLGFSTLVLAFWLLWRRYRGDLRCDAPLENDAERGLGRIMRFAWSALAFSALGLLWELAAWNHPALAASLLKYYWFRLADVAVPIAVCLAVGWLIDRLLQRRSRWAALVALLAVVLPGLYLLAASSQRWFDSCPPADRKMQNYVAWQDACFWVREHTPADALFLVPRHSQSFLWNAQRKEVATWKNVPQDAATLLLWRDRYYDLFFYVDEQGERATYRSLASQGTQRIQEHINKYAVDYVVTLGAPPLQLPVVYANPWYTVYAASPLAKASVR